MPDLLLTQRVTSADAGLSERNIEDLIVSDPVALGLGDIRIVGRQVAAGDGFLDLVAYDDSLSTHYQIELMLGEADSSHIARCLNYWAAQMTANRFTNHVAVLVCESARGRYKPLLSALPSFVPMIVIEVAFHRCGERISATFFPVYYDDDCSVGGPVRKSGRRLAALTSVSVTTLGAAILENPGMVSGSVRNVAEAAGLSVGAAFSALAALEAGGYIARDGGKRKAVRLDALREHLHAVERVSA